MFDRSEETWKHQTKLVAPYGATSDYFGSIVGIYADSVIIGADLMETTTKERIADQLTSLFEPESL